MPIIDGFLRILQQAGTSIMALVSAAVVVMRIRVSWGIIRRLPAVERGISAVMRRSAKRAQVDAMRVHRAAGRRLLCRSVVLGRRLRDMNGWAELARCE